MVKRRKSSELERLRRRIDRLDARSIDELYGLEPVWEPGTAPPGLAPEEFVAVRCPYCKSLDTERKSEFGSTACKSIWVCRSCQQPFEEFKAI